MSRRTDRVRSRATAMTIGGADGRGSAKHPLLLMGCAAATLLISAEASAQSMQTLPQVTVEGKAAAP